MNPTLRQPMRMLRHVREVRALGADGPSRRRLGRNMIQANLKRLHFGWFWVSTKLLGRGPVGVRLRLPQEARSRGRPSAPPEPGPFPEPFPFHYRAATTDLLVLEQVFVEHEYAAAGIAPEGIEFILDLGSNIGLTALWWACRHPAARMILVEPDPDNFALLQQNTAPFKDRCLLVNAAVSHTSGRTRFFRAEREYGHSILRTADCVSEIEVQTLTLNALLDLAGFPRLDLLKMDIEGAERLLMPTIPSWNLVPRFLIAELHPPYEFKDFAGHCQQVGLRAIAPGPGTGAGKVPLAVRASEALDRH
ncbi:MAG: FkbM family methyltransferase [Verrucomicrobia bacterium]|nr:FkbM family methyltransferase [Verrucomicrobiota bacterium]